MKTKLTTTAGYVQTNIRAYYKEDILKLIGEDEKILIPKDGSKEGFKFLEEEMPKRVRNMFRRELREALKHNESQN